jgi:D-alanyl-D-alanine carboxypeptidase
MRQIILSEGQPHGMTFERSKSDEACHGTLHQKARLISGVRRVSFAAMTFVCAAVLTLANVSDAQARKYASIAVDAVTGKVLQGTNEDGTRFPASLTKIMTLYVLFEELEAGRMTLDTKLKVSKFASQQIPSKIGVKPGQTIRVEDAILSLVTKSANDVAVVVAENISGSQPAFAKRMTETARRMGMSKTTFRNASGLPNSEQVTTARDMATLGIQIQKRFPQYYSYFNRRSFTYRGKTYRNHNRLVGRLKGVDGIKTGYIRASGFNLVAAMNRDGRRVVAVVIGGSTGAKRNAAMTTLLNRTIGKAKKAPAGALIAARPITLPNAPALPPRNPRRAVAMASAAPGQIPLQQQAQPQFVAQNSLPNAAPMPPVRQVVQPQFAQAAQQQFAQPQQIQQQLVQRQPAVHAMAPAQPTGQALHPSFAQNTLNAQAAQLQQHQLATQATQRVANRQLGYIPSTQVPAAPGMQIQPTVPTTVAIAQAVPQFDAQGQRQVNTQTITLAPTGPAASSVATTLNAPQQFIQQQQGAQLVTATTAPQPQIMQPVVQPEGMRTAQPARGDYSIQIGAVPNENSAHKLIALAQLKVGQVLADADPFTQVIDKNGTQLWRARFAGFDRSRAVNACAALKKKDFGCFPVRN